MSSRNTFVTSFIYYPDLADAVEDILRQAQDEGILTYNRINPHVFAGIIRTLHHAPVYEVEELQYKLDQLLIDPVSPKTWKDIPITLVCIGDDEKKVIVTGDAVICQLIGENNHETN